MTAELKGIHAKTFQDLDVIKDVLKLDEEKIAELEKENAELQHKVDTLQGFLDRDVEFDNLQKENAELKGLKDVATLIRANNDTVTTLMQLNNMLVSKSQHLTKAKEIIKKLYSHVFQEMDFMELNDYNVQKAEAEQFLSEMEK